MFLVFGSIVALSTVLSFLPRYSHCPVANHSCNHETYCNVSVFCVDFSLTLSSGGVIVRGSQRYNAKWTTGHTGWSDSDENSVRCAGGTSVKSCEISRDVARKIVDKATRIDRRFLATSVPLTLTCFWHDQHMKMDYWLMGRWGRPTQQAIQTWLKRTKHSQIAQYKIVRLSFLQIFWQI